MQEVPLAQVYFQHSTQQHLLHCMWTAGTSLSLQTVWFSWDLKCFQSEAQEIACIQDKIRHWMSICRLLDGFSIPSGLPKQGLLWDIWTERQEKIGVIHRVEKTFTCQQELWLSFLDTQVAVAMRNYND